MNVYLVRHGETEHNKRKNFYGKLDVGLNEKGEKQSYKVGELLKDVKFNKIYISDRKRTRETAERILERNRFYDKEKNIIYKDEKINEIDFGLFEGKSYEEIVSLYPKEQEKWEKDWKNFAPPKGESAVVFYNRVENFMKHIQKEEDGNYLIVTHGGVIRMIYSYILQNNMDFYWNFASRNGDITLIKYEYGNLFIDYILPTKLI
ncbi:alpha-ribazole phosphatase [Clostridium botulinum]|uniref:Alpha-ribazole phosphatase n=1 Tax=Clostridium botulinum (strain Hall / ATCC 3502 / NCTC 13319 / Type A) TaxID=441771 RepID=A5I011_CLOBH|nr:alpha-ribazole phosphatase [Clostridium botulinum]ABS35777.1 alpha-ribazole phosphatase [Clostridium botulinum A str. ATCC 19397]ABS38047.1 alpha-ribazole phosphatase [Clostridium botulinum A str. Hall]AWB16738.1 alpha-ribazole phosphatase [Clostridium botulinum]EGT5613888.1 alpha-ribazole phosphatase [Clostridium botulinum]EGT5620589.1 alpha-ribazole phosphatase [Clostridium botulinum]